MPIQLLLPIVLICFFKINIKPIPLVDQLNAVLRCENDPYILQSSLMEYFTGPNRTGDKLYEAHKITTSQTVYINNLLNGCTNESSFKIEIRQLPKLTIITDITSCQRTKFRRFLMEFFIQNLKEKVQK
jgi:hypothetical protein